MRYLILAPVIVTFFLLSAACAEPVVPADPAAPIIDDILLEKVKVPSQTADPDTYFIELARAADVNFIADATQTFRSIPAAQQPPENTLLTSIVTFAQEQKRSHLRFGKRTFLFWPEPDVVALAIPIIEGKGVRLTGTIPNERELGTLLADYLIRERGWDGKSPDTNIRVHLSDLPIELRHQLRNYVISSVGNSDSGLWLTDEFWESLRLWSGKGRNEETERLVAGGIADPKTERSINRSISFPPSIGH